MENLFDKTGLEKTLSRIEALTPETKAQWGKMSVDQMLAHVNVAYDMFYNMDQHEKPGSVARFLIRLFAKNQVVGPKPYPRSGRTAPVFIIEGPRDFDKEKNILMENLNKTAEHGAHYFDGKESLSFGKLSSQEWNTLFSKHLDHHLTQFGV